jgi:hypothetical protein
MRYLRKRNFLKPNWQSTLFWSCRGEQTGSIAFLSYPDHCELHYRINGEDVRQVVRYAYKAAHYGGSQTYFLCPNCFRRCLILYGGRRFYCRKCWRLTYSSQYEQPFERARTRAAKIRARLADPGIFNPEEMPFPEKPKWMRWPTYWRLFNEDLALCREYEAGFVAGAMAIINRARNLK